MNGRLFVHTMQREPDLSVLDVARPELQVPPDLPIRGGWRTDAGIVLDAELLKLAGLEARCRLVQAQLARRLIDRRAWRPLGFVRLSDYARERLGSTSRTLEQDAAVLRSLDALPQTRTALEAGIITWTQARLLSRAISPADEAVWLELAQTKTTRELEDALRARLVEATPSDGDQRPGANAIAGGITAASAAEAATDDPSICWRITLSRTGRRLWRTACEFASRMAGAPLSDGQVLELVAAEAMSARPGRQEVPWRPEPGEVDARLRRQFSARKKRGARTILAFLAETGVTEGFAWLEPASREPGPAALLDVFAAGLDESDAFELDRRFRALRRAAQRIDAQIAPLLRIGVDRRLFREIGFASTKLYVETRLGFSSRKAWSLIDIERQCWRVPASFREAWRDGRISHLAAELLLPVVNPVHSEAWIVRAGEVTLRRLADEVAWALDHGQPSFVLPEPPPSGTDVRADGLADVSPIEVQMRAYEISTDALSGPPGAVRIDCVCPLSTAILVENAIWELRSDLEPRWRTFERMIASALLDWMDQERHRDPIFERDGWRCTVPGCSSRRNLHDHHLLFRSHGGGNARDNRTTVCAAHHLHGIHGGTIRAYGRAPGEIVWELGCRRDAKPLMRLRGERFVG